MTQPTPGSLPSGVTQPIPGALLRLALPVVASQALRIGYQWVDALWVQGLGVPATAAVTTSVFVMWIAYSLNDVVGTGVMAFVSQLLGSGQRERAGLAAWKGIRASALLGLAASVAGLLAAPSIYGLMARDPATARAGGSYLRIVLGAAPLPMVALTCESIMRSSGNTRMPLLLDLGAVAFNAVLDPLLIYGWGPVHGMGVSGAAWATVLAQALLVAGYLGVAARRHPAFPLAWRAPGPPVRLRGMTRVGIPTALIGILFSASYMAFARSASRFGAASMAVVGIANRIETLEYFFAAALGAAGAALVGQNLGAGRPDRAVQVLRTGIRWKVWISAILTAAILAFPDFFLSLFTQDPAVHGVGAPYLRVLALCFIFTGVEVVTAEAIMGSGHTLVLSWIYGVFSLARIPLAFLVPAWTHSGAVAIAWLITVTCVVRTALIVGWAARGTWLRGLHAELHGAGPPPPGAS